MVVSAERLDFLACVVGSDANTSTVASAAQMASNLIVVDRCILIVYDCVTPASKTTSLQGLYSYLITPSATGQSDCHRRAKDALRGVCQETPGHTWLWEKTHQGAAGSWEPGRLAGTPQREP